MGSSYALGSPQGTKAGCRSRHAFSCFSNERATTSLIPRAEWVYLHGCQKFGLGGHVVVIDKGVSTTHAGRDFSCVASARYPEQWHGLTNLGAGDQCWQQRIARDRISPNVGVFPRRHQRRHHPVRHSVQVVEHAAGWQNILMIQVGYGVHGVTT